MSQFSFIKYPDYHPPNPCFHNYDLHLLKKIFFNSNWAIASLFWAYPPTLKHERLGAIGTHW